MANEKQFGRKIEDTQDIFSADDLLQLQPDNSWGIEFNVPHCTLCTITCASATSVVE